MKQDELDDVPGRPAVGKPGTANDTARAQHEQMTTRQKRKEKMRGLAIAHKDGKAVARRGLSMTLLEERGDNKNSRTSNSQYRTSVERYGAAASSWTMAQHGRKVGGAT